MADKRGGRGVGYTGTEGAGKATVYVLRLRTAEEGDKGMRPEEGKIQEMPVMRGEEGGEGAKGGGVERGRRFLWMCLHEWKKTGEVFQTSQRSRPDHDDYWYRWVEAKELPKSEWRVIEINTELQCRYCGKIKYATVKI